MIGYVIVRDGQYLTKPGMHNSYTPMLQFARLFKTYTEALSLCYENETVEDVQNIFAGC